MEYYDEDSIEVSYINNSNQLRTLLEGLYDFKYDESVKEVHNDTFGYFRFMGSAIFNYSSKLLINHLTAKFGELPWEYEKQLFRLQKSQIVKIYFNFENLICLKDIEVFL
jgi:hypothetical protein